MHGRGAGPGEWHPCPTRRSTNGTSGFHLPTADGGMIFVSLNPTRPALLIASCALRSCNWNRSESGRAETDCPSTLALAGPCAAASIRAWSSASVILHPQNGGRLATVGCNGQGMDAGWKRKDQ